MQCVYYSITLIYTTSSLQIETRCIYKKKLYENYKFNLVNLVFRNLNTIFALTNLLM